MVNTDLAVYGVHLAFWGAFGLAHVIAKQGKSTESESAADTAGNGERAGEQQRTARGSRAVLAVHFVAFGLLYWGVWYAVLPNKVPHLFLGQQVIGTIVIALGAAVMAWARLHFRSWRFRARLEAGHRLATGGPFALVRHPIYVALNLLAVGTALWVPTVFVWCAAVLMIIGSDLRARAEEKLLIAGFGNEYLDYCRHTRRFVPGLY